jgi:DNA polymerase-4
VRARRLCPQAIFVKPSFEKYKAVSRQAREIFERHTPLVEPLSLDEAYLDVSEELTGIPTATEAAEVIRREIREETGLTASAGVAPNKFLAKIASDWKKPNGQFVIRPSQVERFLEPLPVGKLPGVGHATEQILHDHHMITVGDIRAVSPEELVRLFGKFGTRLWELARGIDERPVVPLRKATQVSMENTFDNDITIGEVREFLAGEASKLWAYLERKERRGRTVTVKLRAGDFTTRTRSYTPPALPSSAEELSAVALELVDRFDFSAGTHFRLAGIGVSKFLDDTDASEEEEQEKLF